VVIADVDHAKGERRRSAAVEIWRCALRKDRCVGGWTCTISLRATIEAFSDIDMLVNNAAVVHSASFLDRRRISIAFCESI
jgi:NAD(P)-dependent dehydrogenase (short-subunit alcohol dehydrogenase family)